MVNDAGIELVEILCAKCGKPRRVLPQNAKEVNLCIEHQREHTNAKRRKRYTPVPPFKTVSCRGGCGRTIKISKFASKNTKATCSTCETRQASKRSKAKA